MNGSVRTYKSYRFIKTLLLAFFGVVMTLAVVITVMFFSFRKYIVYTDDGIHLEIPWLASETNENEAP
jgi:hypothetical protein